MYNISPENRMRLSTQKLGANNPQWKGGRPKCLSCGGSVSRYDTKLCTKCYGATRLGENNPAWKGGLNSDPEHKRVQSRKSYHKNTNYHKNWQLKKRFGFTLVEYQVLLTKQKGGCAICGGNKLYGDKKYLAVDHDHNTGVIRGLLCDPCNLGLGKFGDSLALIQKAIVYLKRQRRTKRNVGL